MSEQVAGEFNTTPPTFGSGQKINAQTDSAGRFITVGPGVAGTPAGGVVSVQGVVGGTALPVTIAEAVGSVTWAAPVAVAMTGASKTFVPADAARKALLMWSPSTNAAAGIDIAGGTVVLATAIQLSPGLPPIVFLGADTPAGIVTAIGTNTQNLYYQSGS